MNIEFNGTFIHAGENNSRTLNVSVEEELLTGKTVKLIFQTPGGRVILSDSLQLQQGSCSYLLPYTLLDRYGKLSAQIIITDSQGYCMKSDVFKFDVHTCIEESSAVTDEGEFITLGNLAERLSDIEDSIDANGLVLVTPAPDSVTLTDNTTVLLADNTEYTGTGINTLVFEYPQGDFECQMTVTTAASGTVAISLPADSVNVGTIPALNQNGKTYVFSVMNKKVCCSVT